jgi:ATP-dependent helicase/nuclease subunit A
MKLPEDIEARNESILPTKSCLLEAGAGSGKTEQLSRKMLALIPICENPEDILGITFTKKSAMEMVIRMIKYLKLGELKNPPKETHLFETWELAKKAVAHSNSKGWDLIKNPSRLNIKTIDSLCLDILNKNVIANGFGKSVAPIDNPEQLYLSAVQLFVNCENDSKSAKLRRNVVAYCGNNSIRTINYLVDLLSNREQWIEELNNSKLSTLVEKNAKKVINFEAEDLQKHLTNIDNQDIQEIVSIVNENKIAKEGGINTVLPLKNNKNVTYCTLSYFCNIIYSSSSNKIKTTYSIRDGLNKENKTEKIRIKEIASKLIPQKDTIQRVSLLPRHNLSKIQKRNYDNIGQALLICEKNLSKIMKSDGVADFAQVTIDTLALLKNKKECHEIHGDYQHILIDEFQDTSSCHHELVHHLVKNWENTKKTLFLVGDPKQSLYLFRSAALGLFLETKVKGVNKLSLDVLQLSVNFRSYKSIVDWVNRVFSTSLPLKENANLGAASYTHTTPFSDKELPDSINHIITNDSGDKEFDEAVEAEKIARTIKDNLLNVPHETNAVLIRSRSVLKKLDKAFKKYNIKYTGIDLLRLNNVQAIIDLVNLTKYIIDPDDNNALLGVLRAPYVGLKQTQLALILEECESKLTNINTEIRCKSTTDKLCEDSNHRLKNLIDCINIYAEPNNKIKLRYYIKTIWKKLKGDEFIGDLEDVDVECYFDLIGKVEKYNTIKDISVLDTELEKLFVQPSPDANHLVQILTLHKSKGLEFDNVFIPCMHKRSTNSNSELMVWNECRIGFKTIFLLDTKPEHGNNQTYMYDYIKHISKKKEILEMARLAYVGVTRAVKRLYLSYIIASTEKGLKKPSETALLSFIWDAIYADILLEYNKQKDEIIELNLLPDESNTLNLLRYKTNEL